MRGSDGLGRTPYFAFARQEAKHIAGSLFRGARHGSCHRHIANVARLYGEHATFRTDNIGVANVRGDLVRV